MTETIAALILKRKDVNLNNWSVSGFSASGVDDIRLEVRGCAVEGLRIEGIHLARLRPNEDQHL